MRPFKKVAIVGIGLIGGSLGLAIKQKRLARQVVGVSRREKNLAFAKKIGAIDWGSQDISIIEGADAVLLATPIRVILELAPLISKVIDRNCLVTDVGSTKSVIVKKLSSLFPNYVGSHPLAGSEKTSIIHAQADIFENTLCILTPTAGTRRLALAKIKALWNELGAKIVNLSPALHDRILAFVSHLPHAVAFSLIGAIPLKYLRFAAGGLKDTTRIAASDSELWADILLTNRKNIHNSISLLERNLKRMRDAIREGNRKELIRILEQARAKRNRLL